MELKDRLLAGSVAEKEYLKARKEIHAQQDYKSSDLAKVENDFITKLVDIGFTSISDYHSNVYQYGHYWRELKNIKIDDKNFIPAPSSTLIADFVQQAILDGSNFLLSTVVLNNLTVVYVPDGTKADELVDTEYCKSVGITIVPVLTSGGAYITEPGDIGILFILQRPAESEAVLGTLQRVTQTVLLNYGVETEITGNDLLAMGFKGYETGVKIWGGSNANLGKVIVVAGSLTMKFDVAKANKILKAKPEIKKLHGLNDLLGKTLDSQEILKALISEWLLQTESTLVK